MNGNRRRIISAGAFLLGLVVMVSPETAWGQTIAWTQQVSTRAVAVDTSGSICVAVRGGQHTLDGVRKYDANGHALWTHQDIGPGGQASAVAVDTSGNIYLAGWTWDRLPGQNVAGGNVLLRKYDAHGRVLWTRKFSSEIPGSTFEDTDFDGAFGVAVDASGSIYVAGETVSGLPGQRRPPGWGDAFLRKYDTDGAELWTRQFGAPEAFAFTQAFAVAVDAGGSIYVAGHTTGTLADQRSAGIDHHDDAFVRKYDANGAELWTRQFGTPEIDVARAVAADPGGSIYVAGDTNGTLPGQSFAGDCDAFVRKYDANGSELWTHQFGTQGYDAAWGIAADASGITYVVGYAFVRKYDDSGRELWTRQYGSASAVAVDASGSIYVASSGLIKFVPCVSVLSGDVNGDCVVDCQDIGAVQSTFGVKAGQPGWYAPADVVVDNIIDVRDLASVAQKLPASTSCP